MKKLDITREQYCRMVTAIQEHYKELTKFENSINEFNDGTYICKLGDVLVCNVIWLLTQLTHDKEDEYNNTWLSWWLWEQDVEKIAWDKDNNRIDISTVDKLYDFLEANYNAEVNDA